MCDDIWNSFKANGAKSEMFVENEGMGDALTRSGYRSLGVSYMKGP